LRQLETVSLVKAAVCK